MYFAIYYFNPITNRYYFVTKDEVGVKASIELMTLMGHELVGVKQVPALTLCTLQTRTFKTPPRCN